MARWGRAIPKPTERRTGRRQHREDTEIETSTAAPGDRPAARDIRQPIEPALASPTFFAIVPPTIWSFDVDPDFEACRAAPRASLALLAALAFAISGCGRAGPLEPPPNASAVAKPADFPKGGVRSHKSNPQITAPKTPFVLDPLL